MFIISVILVAMLDQARPAALPATPGSPWSSFEVSPPELCRSLVQEEGGEPWKRNL